MKYTVISNDSLEKLIELVNEHIKNGWILQGGVATRNHVYHRTHHGDAEFVVITFCQAMVKQEEQPH